MKRTAFIFPGQGAQTTGMGRDFHQAYRSSRNVFETASEQLGYDMCDLLFNDERAQDLNITENTQPAILTASCAMLFPLLETGVKPDFTAGLSLGEYTAHVCSGSLSFEECVSIVRKRGKYMQEAVPAGVGTMAAIIGLDRKLVEEACAEAGGRGAAEPANFNCPGQIVISGEARAVEKACALCRDKGAKRAIVLPVSAPFHSSLLVNAGNDLKKELEKYKFKDMKYKVISNVTADVISDSSMISELLVSQVTSPVLWWDSILTLIGKGVDTFVEIGPGKTLTGFLKKIDPNVTGYNISTADEFEEVRRMIWN